MYWSIVGRPYPMDSTLITPGRTDVPSFGTLTNWLAQRDGYSGAVPPYVITPKPHCDSFVYLTPGQFGACLGPRYDPFVLNSNPNDEQFEVPNLGMAPELTGPRLRDPQFAASIDRPLGRTRWKRPTHQRNGCPSREGTGHCSFGRSAASL